MDGHRAVLPIAALIAPTKLKSALRPRPPLPLLLALATALGAQTLIAILVILMGIRPAAPMTAWNVQKSGKIALNLLSALWASALYLTHRTSAATLRAGRHVA